MCSLLSQRKGNLVKWLSCRKLQKIWLCKKRRRSWSTRISQIGSMLFQLMNQHVSETCFECYSKIYIHLRNDIFADYWNGFPHIRDFCENMALVSVFRDDDDFASRFGFDSPPPKVQFSDMAFENPPRAAGLALALTSKYYLGWRLIATQGETHMCSTIALVFKENILECLKNYDSRKTQQGFEITMGSKYIGKNFIMSILQNGYPEG